MTTIRQDITLDGTPLVRLENALLRVDVAPGVGGRVVSLMDKASGHEFLWHNARLKLERCAPGSKYDPNFYGGIDELIPNDMPEVFNGMKNPEHGELWTTPLAARVEGETLVLTGTLPQSGLSYERRMTLRPNSPHLDIDYCIGNPTPEVRQFMWKLHAALQIEPGDRIECPARTAKVIGRGTRRNSTDPFPWPIIEGQRADIIPALDGTLDFMFLYDLEEGRMALVRPTAGLTVAYTFDKAVFPYCWLFASFGWLDGHYTAVLEPCTTMPVSVNEAVSLGQCTSILQPGETLATRMTLYAGPVEGEEA
jgi:hypothetical protein